jgi:hypothetical protein
MDQIEINFTSFTNPLSKNIAQELENTDSIPNGFREQFIIPTKADLAKQKLYDGTDIPHIGYREILLI